MLAVDGVEPDWDGCSRFGDNVSFDVRPEGRAETGSGSALSVLVPTDALGSCCIGGSLDSGCGDSGSVQESDTPSQSSSL